MKDPISDMIIRIKNASSARKESVLIPYSKLKWEIASLLESEGYIKSIIRKGKKVAKFIDVGLVYQDGIPRIANVKRISKPSRRVYRSVKELRPVRHGYGLSIMSTPSGIRTGSTARKEKVGGEVLFEVW